MRTERHVTSSPVEAQCCLDGYLSAGLDPDTRAYIDPLRPWVLVFEFDDEEGPDQESDWTDEQPEHQPRVEPWWN